MSNVQFDCIECGESTEAPSDSARLREELCYKHYVKGISFSFRGPRGGRESFHDDTLHGVATETVEAARSQGREVRPKTKVGGTAFTPPTKGAK